MDGPIDENRPSLKPVRDLFLQGTDSLGSGNRFRRQIERSTRHRAKPDPVGFHQNRNRHGNLQRVWASFTATLVYQSSHEAGISQGRSRQPRSEARDASTVAPSVTPSDYCRTHLD